MPYGYEESEAYNSMRNAIDNEISNNRKIDEKQEVKESELQTQIDANKSDVTALKAKDVELQGEIDLKASEAAVEALNTIVTAHTSNTFSHVTESDKENWNGKIDSSALEGYATEQWVENQNYLTDHQDLSDYATIAYVNEQLELKADKTDIPTDFYTQEEVNAMMSMMLTRIENVESANGVVVADSAEEVQNATANSNLVLTSSNAIQALTSNTVFNTLTIVGGNSNTDIKAIANDNVTVDGMTVNGEKGETNGRMQLSANTVNIKNVTIESGATAYNIFESSQNTGKSEYFTTEYNASNVTCDNVELNHNAFNIYTFADDAVVTIKDSYFNLDPTKSNVLRLANYTNATGVTINFENVDWTYENAGKNDFEYAGLVLYQPSSKDDALNGDVSKIETWTFNFKNCKYNGEKVNNVNFGEHNQVAYGYYINKGGISDLSSIATFNFE